MRMLKTSSIDILISEYGLEQQNMLANGGWNIFNGSLLHFTVFSMKDEISDGPPATISDRYEVIQHRKEGCLEWPSLNQKEFLKNQ